jgi:hypothetical protein
VTLFFSPTLPGPLPARGDTGVNLLDIPSDAPPGIAYMLQLCLLNMHEEVAKSAPLVSNNAVWAVGEMCLALGHDGCFTVVPSLANHIAMLLMSVVSSVSSVAQLSWDGDTPVVLRQNLAISLGRLCMICPDEVAQDMESPLLSPDCLHAWCRWVIYILSSRSNSLPLCADVEPSSWFSTPPSEITLSPVLSPF